MQQQLLESLGLETNEWKVYIAALSLWSVPASVIAKKTWLPRSTARYNCEQLVKQGLLMEMKRWNTKYFTAEPPAHLQQLIDIQKVKLRKKQDDLNKHIPSLTKLYNPYAILPDVSYFEWTEWLEKVLNDSLNAKETIYTYANVDGMNKYIKDINIRYLEKRKKWKIMKKWLVVKTPYAEKLVPKYDKTVTEIRFLDSSCFFSTEIEIYDWKVAMITYTDNNPVWIIINNKEIYEMHRNLFELQWKSEEIPK